MGECRTLWFMTGVHQVILLIRRLSTCWLTPDCVKYYNSLGFDFFADVGDIFFAFRHLPPEAVVETLLFLNFLQGMRILLSATKSVVLAQKG